MRIPKFLAGAALAASLLLVGVPAAHASTPVVHPVPDTSPRPCPNPWGNGPVCYQIDGSGTYVNYWWATNATTFTVNWRLYGPSGLWSNKNLGPGQSAWDFWQKDTLKGSWCAFFVPVGVVGAFKTEEICESVL